MGVFARAPPRVAPIGAGAHMGLSPGRSARTPTQLSPVEGEGFEFWCRFAG
jgi:hypothetical protein